MHEEFSNLNKDEQLKAENDFLKMKIMLESGADFGGVENNELPAQIENDFLNNIVAFEKQFEEHKRIKVFDKIGNPIHFKPVNEIPDNEINNAWSELNDYLNKHSVDLGVCSPNISSRELYRFTTEELFQHEMDDMDLPGWTSNFIYDEFHPDVIYDNTRAATEDCINIILQKDPIDWLPHFKDEGLQLNSQTGITIDEFKKAVNQFKLIYDNLEITESSEPKCNIKDKVCIVEASYFVTATSGKDSYLLSGNWKVRFELDEDLGYWYITGVFIEGINF